MVSAPAKQRKVDDHLRGHRRDPHADDVAAPADHAPTRSPTPRSARTRPARRIVHLHARDPKDGRPDQRPEAFEPFLRRIKKACDVVINITTGGAPTMLVEERLKPCAHFKPEVASLNMGSMNFGLFPMLRALQGVQVRLGAALPRGLRRPHLQEHVPRTSTTS